MSPRMRWTIAALCVGGPALLVWLLLRPPSPPSHLVSIQGKGFYGQGTAILLSDLMELQNQAIVLPQGTNPPATVPRLLLEVSRQGDVLTVNARLNGRALPPQQGSPSEALTGLAKALSLNPPGPELIPVDAGHGWELLDLAGRSQDETTPDFVARAQALVQKEPRCASARLALSVFLTRYLVEHMDMDTMEAQQACERNFEEGLSLLPAYPRLSALNAIQLSDIGRQREALHLLQDALRLHPGNPALLNSLAYAARTSGLIDVANRALNLRSKLIGVPRGQSNLADNTLLYSGDFKAFEANLTTVPPGPMRSFYQGYARLLAGDRAGALPYFVQAKPGGLGSTLFVRLAEVYRLDLEGHPTEASAALDELGSERMWIHLPDGEFTFKLAEAYGYLGRKGEAMDAAERAAVQGFGCVAWFERAPFLVQARQLPRWISLDTHLRARQRLLEKAFPASAFHL